MDLDDIQIDISQLENKNQSSQLGFFSKPYRFKIQDSEFIIKRYHPTKKDVDWIVQRHNEYVESLRAIGINVPKTKIQTHKKGKKQELVIFQKAFKDQELLRTLFSQKPIEDLQEYLRLMYNEIFHYWKNKPSSSEIGFHPTLRNYALKENQLVYFDTFPPMNMPQRELNKLIRLMAPVANWIKKLVPLKALNRVSNEYYQLDKMFLGVFGSAIRLRPEFANEIMEFTRGYLSQISIDPETQEQLLKEVQKPPKLSGLWRFVRRLTGNIGKPNVKVPRTK